MSKYSIYKGNLVSLGEIKAGDIVCFSTFIHEPFSTKIAKYETVYRRSNMLHALKKRTVLKKVVLQNDGSFIIGRLYEVLNVEDLVYPGFTRRLLITYRDLMTTGKKVRTKSVYLYSEDDLYKRRLLKCKEVDFDKVNMSVKDEFIKRLSNFT